MQDAGIRVRMVESEHAAGLSYRFSRRIAARRSLASRE